MIYLLCWRVNNAFTGLIINIPTIIIGNIDIELPAIYIINKFIGTCLRGPKAKSHDFLIIKWLESDSLIESAAWNKATAGV